MSFTARLFILAALCALLQGGLAIPNYSLARRSLPTDLASLTNAERLARGLPLKKPQFKRHGMCTTPVTTTKRTIRMKLFSHRRQAETLCSPHYRGCRTYPGRRRR